MRDSDVPYVELTEAQRQRFEAAAGRALAARRRQRRSISKGRRGRFVWHIYRPTQPTMFGRVRVQKGRASFSLRWVIGWVKALPWIDPNDSHDDYLLTVAIREALGEGS